VVATAARAFLRARRDLVTPVECGDTGRADDVDTPEDLERVSRTVESRGAHPG